MARAPCGRAIFKAEYCGWIFVYCPTHTAAVMKRMADMVGAEYWRREHQRRGA